MAAYPARVPLVIDTYNVLHVTGVLPPELAVGEPEALARLIAEDPAALHATDDFGRTPFFWVRPNAL